MGHLVSPLITLGLIIEVELIIPSHLTLWFYESNQVIHNKILCSSAWKCKWLGLIHIVVIQSLSCLTFCDPIDFSIVCCTPLSPGICSNPCSLSQWCCLNISSSDALFSFGLQSFPESGSLRVSQLFTSGGHSVGALVSILPMNIQG